MNILKKTWYLIKKNWFISVLVVGGFFVIVSALLSVFSPVPVTAPVPSVIQSGVGGISTDFSGLSYVGGSYDVPEQLSVYSVTQIPVSQAAVEQDLIRSFGLDEDPGVPNVWKGADFTMSKNSLGEYLLTTLEPNYPQSPVTYPVARSVAEQFLQQYFPSIPVVPVEADTEYLAGEYELESVTRNRATTIRIPFTYSLDGFPVLYNQSVKYPFLVTVSAALSVQKIMFEPLFVAFGNPVPYTTISETAALQNIQNGTGVLITASRGEAGPLSLSTVTSGTLTTVELQYRVDNTQQFAYPYYVFSGEMRDVNGVAFLGTILTPAILTK